MLPEEDSNAPPIRIFHAGMHYRAMIAKVALPQLTVDAFYGVENLT